jgi:hypothetical protein
MSHVVVTYKTDFGVDLLHLIYSQLGTTGNNAIAILHTFPVHRCAPTRILRLH